MKKCHSCGQVWDGSPGSQPGRTETCVKCGADLHCCLNCSLYDPSAPRQCTSRTTEYVKDKERGNYCEEFMFGSRPGGTDGPKDDMGQKWKDVFGG
jgi:hypothetical protein